jgi:hypothetical protein
LETIERDYSDQSVSFYYVYKSLAHPEWDGYVTPYTKEERLMHVAEAKRTLGSRFTWICDTMDNDLKTAMGRAPNSEWIIDENNVIVARRDWSNPSALRKDLEQLVGPVDRPTRVSDLDMPTQPPPEAAPSGVGPRLKREARMAAIIVAPVTTDDPDAPPFYAKLRAEGSRELLQSGGGKLYLRFMMDPLYKVHWNNLSPPIKVQVIAPSGVRVSSTVLEGPEVEAEADIDPREFLVDLSGGKPGDVIRLDAFYYACHETEGWCRPVEQSYTVTLTRDRDAGTVFPPGRRGGQREPRRRR